MAIHYFKITRIVSDSVFEKYLRCFVRILWNHRKILRFIKIFALILQILCFLWIASGVALAMTVRGSGIVLMSSLRDSA